jgi:hypothetical protein
MKAFLLVAGFVVLGAWGCTVVEELPTRPSLIRVVDGQRPRPNGAPPSPMASPSPGPRPSPSPTPAPSPTPTPIPSPSSPPSPSPRPSSTPPAPLPPNTIDSIRVGFFGINCGRGVPVPRNGEKILPRGCRGYVTASPKDRNGDDVPLAIHGPDIDWFVLEGEDKIDVQAPTFPSDFNKDLVGVREGSFGLCATVREVTGCLMGTVVPR